jgi:hypothetical protein
MVDVRDDRDIAEVHGITRGCVAGAAAALRSSCWAGSYRLFRICERGTHKCAASRLAFLFSIDGTLTVAGG